MDSFVKNSLWLRLRINKDDVQIFSVSRKVSSWLQLSNLGDAID